MAVSREDEIDAELAEQREHVARIEHLVALPARGGHLDLHNFRERHWRPALRAAGLEYRRPYDLRHTYATFSIAAGISRFALARRMGTSLAMIDRT